MKIRQLNKENLGIDNMDFPGYQHHDGINTHEALVHDMYAFADDLKIIYPNARKFLDIGSGAAFLSKRVREFGDEYLAVSLDGNYETLELDTIDKNYHFVLRTDVDYTLVDDSNDIVKFDVITSFEHFEHIQSETFPQFIENIKKHMHKDSVLYASAASWAYEGEVDRVHCNVKPEFLWRIEMEETYGFTELDRKLFNSNNTSGCGLRWEMTAELAYKLK
jgi:2-polyprenyl-3-methyl-5-hydroxy-6-metoxy-1,4-benzoquinol methylase